jgi:CxxC motif-containing protein (DUF1111 family)
MKDRIQVGNWFVFSLFALSLLAVGLAANAQSDPGPRPGLADAGGPIKGLNSEEEKLFWASWEKFKEVYSVSGTIEKGVGLGPTFNGNGCAQCHAQPAAGGSSSSPRSPQVRRVILRDQHLALDSESNPQVALASLHRVPGGNQTVPPFIAVDGPIRVARFIKKADGTPDGEVHQIYTVAGREDARGCILPQPNFAEEIAKNNVVFRIPTPTFGAGLVEAIPDEALVANLNSTLNQRRALGIGGRFSRSPNDGTINRFGWKAQNKSLLIFAAESFNVEMGVTNEAFPNKRNETPECVFNALPEDKTKVQPRRNEVYQPSDFTSDVVNFAAFMRLSAPPTPATHTPSELKGQVLFSEVGCALCHSPALQTGKSMYGGLSNIRIEPYSDFALHHMGPGLADHILQASATGDQFRTAPLWGLGQRIFFVHDGRTSDLLVAIQAHGSKVKDCRPKALSMPAEACSSEANAVILRFQALSQSEKQDILNFLRSL